MLNQKNSDIEKEKILAVKEYRDFVFAKPKISEEEQGQHTLAAADTEGRPDKNYTDFGRIVVEIWD